MQTAPLALPRRLFVNEKSKKTNIKKMLKTKDISMNNIDSEGYSDLMNNIDSEG